MNNFIYKHKIIHIATAPKRLNEEANESVEMCYVLDAHWWNTMQTNEPTNERTNEPGISNAVVKMVGLVGVCVFVCGCRMMKRTNHCQATVSIFSLFRTHTKLTHRAHQEHRAILKPLRPFGLTNVAKWCKYLH